MSTRHPSVSSLDLHVTATHACLPPLVCAGDLVCIKTGDGHMSVHSWPSGKTFSSWKVPGCGSSTTPSYSKRCSFGHTRDGHFVCAGVSLLSFVAAGLPCNLNLSFMQAWLVIYA